MKNLFIFLILAFFNTFCAFAQYDSDGNLIANENPSSIEVFDIDPPETGQLVTDCEWEQARFLTETNLPNNGESYPWISADGLRIYFTSNADFFWMSRPHIDSTFRDIQPLSVNTPGREVSCWLDEDELEIWFSLLTGNEAQLMYAQRPHRDSSFSEVTTVLITGTEGTFTSPSMTPDRSQLFLFNNNNGRRILIYEAFEPNKYILNDSLTVPAGVNAGPGQLSRDGYKFFFSNITFDLDGTEKIVSLSRNDLSETFDIATYEELPIEINGLSQYNSYPSVTADGNILTFVGAPEILLSTLDLAIANGTGCSTATKDISEEKPFQLKVYPNPTDGDLTINWQNLEPVEMQIVNLQGKVLQREAVQKQAGNELTFSVKDFPHGLYFCRLMAHNGWSETVKFLVE